MIEALRQSLHDPIRFALPFFLLAIVLELVALRVQGTSGDRYSARDSMNSLITGAIAIVLTVVFHTVELLLYAVLYTYVAPWHLPADRWPTWVGAFLAVDLLWYFYHRCSHRIRVMWAAHQAHHNSNYFNTSTAVRQKWNQWFGILIWVPLPLLGVPPWMVLAMFSVNLIYQFFTHTETIGKLPRPIEFIFNTPSHHRVHHGSDALYLDRNYGGVFIIWDRRFGTFQAEEHRPRYGLTTPIHTNNLVRLQFHEYAAMLRDIKGARRFRDRLGFVFGPPGWRPAVSEDAAPSSPAGSELTAVAR